MRVDRPSSSVRDLNAFARRPHAARLPVASEACFSIAEHLGTVARRVDRLSDIADSDAAGFVRNERTSGLAESAIVRAEASDNGLSLERPLDLTARCVSPSDFGFHNVLLESNGRLRFIDFEYAGWDDPSKLICDFFCQPAVPAPASSFERFARALSPTDFRLQPLAFRACPAANARVSLEVGVHPAQ